VDKANEFLKQAEFLPVGETGLMVSFGHIIDPDILHCASALVSQLEKHPFPGLGEFEASYTGVTMFFDPLVLAKEPLPGQDMPEMSHAYQVVTAKVKELLAKITFGSQNDARHVRVPVCYGGEYGPDLGEVADYHNMTTDEVVKIHTSGKYLVYMIGFAPGFPYVGGMDPRIATPRRKTPRLKIPKGSVGIAGAQTGAYPLETPGGWQLIGRTPLELFRPNDTEHPSVLQAGDNIEFYAVTEKEFADIAAKEKGGHHNEN
jgi:inhibitor of KinA